MQSVTTSLRRPTTGGMRQDGGGGKGVTPSTRSQSWHPRHPTISRVANSHRAVGTNNGGGGWAEGSFICGGPVPTWLWSLIEITGITRR